jgi:signal peptidase I
MTDTTGSTTPQNRDAVDSEANDIDADPIDAQSTDAESTDAANDAVTDDATAGTGGAKKPSKSRSAKLFARDVLFILLAAIVISFVIKTFLIRSFYIPSSSMENTLQIHDRVIVNELEPRFIGISRGDVVVFKDPGGWLPAQTVDTRNTFQKVTDAALGFVGLAAPDSNDHLIKRVIGLPGDHITCCGNSGTMRVNGVPLDEPYIKILNATKAAAPYDFDITVPAGELWVMGDNRDNSEDSLAHYRAGDPGGGFLPEDDVVGRAFVISWPSSHWGWLDNYPTTFRGTDADSDSTATPTPTTTSAP